MRFLLARAVAVPIMVVGWLGAHWLSYRLVIPDPTERARVLAASGHQYFSYLPFILAFTLSLLVVALVLRVASTARGVRGADLVAWPFGFLPPLIFAFEEYFDRLVHDGTVQLATATEKTFVVGVLIQIPVGICAYAAVRALLRWADRLGSALGRLRSRPPLTAPRAGVARPVARLDVRRISVLASWSG